MVFGCAQKQGSNLCVQRRKMTLAEFETQETELGFYGVEPRSGYFDAMPVTRTGGEK